MTSQKQLCPIKIIIELYQIFQVKSLWIFANADHFRKNPINLCVCHD